MKHILLTLSLMIILLLSSTVLKAQSSQMPAYNISIHTGYSWLNGIIGAEYIVDNNIGMSVGWMPTRLPISKDWINSTCFALTYYTKCHTNGYSFYASTGVSFKGYSFEDTVQNTIQTLPVTILMVGGKYTTNFGVKFKVEIGRREDMIWIFKALSSV